LKHKRKQRKKKISGEGKGKKEKGVEDELEVYTVCYREESRRSACRMSSGAVESSSKYAVSSLVKLHKVLRKNF
jgi:hypothetical protein